MTVSWFCIIQSPAIVSAAGWTWIHELKHYMESASGVMRCPVSSPQSTSVNGPCPLWTWTWMSPLDRPLTFTMENTLLAFVGHTVGLPQCVFGELEQGYAALSKPSFLFKWYVSFNSPYHEVVKHSWNASFTLEIISWVRRLREPRFSSLLFTRKCCIFTQGVSPFMRVFCQRLQALH